MKVKGGSLMLFVDGKSISYATNHTLEINAETANTSNNIKNRSFKNILHINNNSSIINNIIWFI